MLRKAATLPDVWEVKRCELYYVQLEATLDDPDRFMDLLQRFALFLIHPKTMNALADDEYGYVAELCRERLLPLISEFDKRHPDAKSYQKTGKEMSGALNAYEIFRIITRTYKIRM